MVLLSAVPDDGSDDDVVAAIAVDDCGDDNDGGCCAVLVGNCFRISGDKSRNISTTVANDSTLLILWRCIIGTCLQGIRNFSNNSRMMSSQHRLSNVSNTLSVTMHSCDDECRRDTMC